MANPRYRAASIWAGGTKLAEVHSNSFKAEGGDEPVIGDPGFMGYSDGAITSQIDAQAVIPIAGMKFDILTPFLNKQDVDMQLTTMLGHTVSITMRILKCDVKSTHKNGMQEGDFSFGGGEPNVQ